MGFYQQSMNSGRTNINKNRQHHQHHIHTGFTSSRVLGVLGVLICLAVGLNVYLSILHDSNPSHTIKHSNVEPMVEALNISIQKLQDDDDLIQAITAGSSARQRQEQQKSIQSEVRKAPTSSSSNTLTRRTTTTTTTTTTAKTTTKIQIVLPPKEIAWIQKRTKIFQESLNLPKLRHFYSKADQDSLSRSGSTNPQHNYVIDSRPPPATTNSTTTSTTSSKARKKIDRGIAFGEGPWLDFMVAGNPKCGTTTLMANLRRLAPMPVKDFCTGVTQTLHNSYVLWPNTTNYTTQVISHMGPHPSNWLRGSKCPRFLNQNFLLGFGALLPKTKFIIGIRHPMDWYTSFWNMHQSYGPATLLRNIKICPCPVDNLTGLRPKKCLDLFPNEQCFGECRCHAPLCLHRARLHLPLARLGKTLLSKTERQWLAPQDDDGGRNLFNANISNPIFLYDVQQMRHTEFWNDLATFLGVSHIPNEEYHGSHGSHPQQQQQRRSVNTSTNNTREQTQTSTSSSTSLCGKQHDYLRSLIMNYSYELSMWLQLYLLPLGADTNRKDVIIAGMMSSSNPSSNSAAGHAASTSNSNRTEELLTLVESYKYDPCQRLIRRDSDGTYILKEELRNENTTPFDDGKSNTNIDEILGMDITIPKQC